jgi:hypothetical protein
MPLLRKPVRALRTTLSSSAARAEVTISFARHTVLIEERERLEASRCDTSVSREMSCCTVDRDWDLEEESEAWLRLAGGEADMVKAIRMYQISKVVVLSSRMCHLGLDPYMEPCLRFWDVG